jgi:transcriptional regulator with XRE-family HTH domain
VFASGSYVQDMPDSAPTFSDAIAASVRAERARLKLTQVELGERMGLPGFTISDIETGRRAVTANDLPLLCEVFKVSLAELARRADPQDLARLRLV